jgi:hypothetical protein
VWTIYCAAAPAAPMVGDVAWTGSGTHLIVVTCNWPMAALAFMAKGETVW